MRKQHGQAGAWICYAIKSSLNSSLPSLGPQFAIYLLPQFNTVLLFHRARARAHARSLRKKEQIKRRHSLSLQKERESKTSSSHSLPHSHHARARTYTCTPSSIVLRTLPFIIITVIDVILPTSSSPSGRTSQRIMCCPPFRSPKLATLRSMSNDERHALKLTHRKRSPPMPTTSEVSTLP